MRSPVLLTLCLLCGCGPSEKKVELRFAAKVGGDDFSCTRTFPGLGTKATSASFTDFKLFVHGVTLEDTQGKKVALTLTQDGTNQLDDVALLDFEDGKGTCATSSPQTRTVVTGTVPAGFEAAALAFDVGFPEAKNHLDATTAKAPLNEPGMWWSWTGGFKFLRLDAKVPETFYFHLGAAGCDGEPSTGFHCQTANLPHVRLAPFAPSSFVVWVDVAQLYAQSDLTLRPDNKTDFVPGCMSEATDPDCAPLFGQLGLASTPQVVFTAHQEPTK